MRDFMIKNGIEYFAVVPFDKCIVINEPMLKRHFGDVTPKSVIVFIVPYYTGDYPERNVSLYAVSRDYHVFFKSLYEELPSNFKGYADSSPIAEVHIAAASGLGIIGDNGLLINEKHGSFIFIGEIITDYEFDSYDEIKPIQTCEHCGLCGAVCPSKSDCLSAVTQKKGDLTDEEIALIRKYSLVWGCDLCQTVCPHNSDLPLTDIAFFYEDRRSVIDEGCDIKDRAYEWRGKKCIERNIKLLKG
jgi:Uncharacterized Fe-S protein